MDLRYRRAQELLDRHARFDASSILARDHVPSPRFLIVNADDFGLTSGVNRGIVESHERGIVTSASLMVRAPAAAEAAAYARSRDKLDVGLHADLRHWRTRGHLWSRVRSEAALRKAVAVDLRDQLERFRGLVGADPTHLDSHHHRHRIDSLRSIFFDVAHELDVPLRHFAPAVQFRGDFYGHDGEGRPQPEAISSHALIEVLNGLEPGVTELGCHPGYPEGLRSWYREERILEVRALCDNRVHTAIQQLGIRLISFRDGALRHSGRAHT